MKKHFALTLLTLALASLLMPPAASAIIPCSYCPTEEPGNLRCIGVCNGTIALFCSDYFFLGCTSNENFAAPPADPLDTIFPTPFFLLPEATATSLMTPGTCAP